MFHHRRILSLLNSRTTHDSFPPFFLLLSDIFQQGDAGFNDTISRLPVLKNLNVFPPAELQPESFNIPLYLFYLKILLPSLIPDILYILIIRYPKKENIIELLFQQIDKKEDAEIKRKKFLRCSKIYATKHYRPRIPSSTIRRQKGRAEAGRKVVISGDDVEARFSRG